MVKELLKILAGAFLVFQLLAIAQEWEVFAASWLGQEDAAPELSAETMSDVEATLRSFLVLRTHWYATGGDPRFAERLPASEAVLQEVLEDHRYLAHLGRRQEDSLEGFEVLDVERLERDAVAVRTREEWSLRLFLPNGEMDGKPRRETFQGRYRLVRQGQAWRVDSWEPNRG